MDLKLECGNLSELASYVESTSYPGESLGTRLMQNMLCISARKLNRPPENRQCTRFICCFVEDVSNTIVSFTHGNHYRHK